MAVYPIVLAGGRGTRLWPLSRADKPKQFLPLHDGESLFQKTLERHRSMDTLAAPWVVCGLGDRFQVTDALAQSAVAEATVLIEPAARNTAPAIAATAAALLRTDPEAVLLVLPSDHLVLADACYFATLHLAFDAARAGRMVAFGVVPTHPETGYGYIAAAPGPGPLRTVRRFTEKPPAEEAARMVADGEHYWNAGFFAFGAAALLDELARTAPDVAAAAKAAADGQRTTCEGLRLLGEDYADAPDISIDYALFERTDKASVAPVACPWSDVGSWDAYRQTLTADSDGNAVVGKGLAFDTENSLIMSNRAEVVALGLRDTAVIAADDAILVCPLDRAQDVKAVVATLKANKRHDLVDVSSTVNRPWGGYTSVISGPRFQVKHLFVLPGRRLSLQKHHHRAEHWVVVRGTAEVTIDERVITLSENESTYLPLGCVHRLANPGRITLELIEVQTGSYLGEDDIVRIEDVWGRTSQD